MLSHIIGLMPARYKCLHEPFVGGGALSFALQSPGTYISDLNAELINFYKVLKAEPLALIDHLRGFENSKAGFYDLREADRQDDFFSRCPSWRAGRYLFLNRTCFNGAMRVNRKGQLNCSYGTPVSDARAFETGNIMRAHEAMRAMRIYGSPYQGVLNSAQEGDFVYFDPPYVSVKPSGDIHYTAAGFTPDHQGALANLCGKLTRRGVRWIVSNADVGFIRRLYGHYEICEIEAPRCFAGSVHSRGKAREVMIRNYS